MVVTLDQIFDFFCIGGASVDLILKVPSLPVSGEKLVVEFHGQQAGGLVANAACAAARLGLRTAWAGTVADDDYGKLILAGFAQFGVDSHYARIFPEGNTDFTVILLEPSGERTILVVPTLPAPPTLDAATLAVLRQARMVYTVPFAPGYITALADAVHSSGGLLALDVEASSRVLGDDLRAALQQADLVFCTLPGLQLASGAEDLHTGAQQLLEMGVSCVVVTKGSKGAWSFTMGQALHQPAFEVTAADTTGAGDCFHAAFAFGYLAGWPMEETLRFASAAAALSVQKIGARTGFQTSAVVNKFAQPGKP